MAGNLLKEDNGALLCENNNTLGLARKVDYKFSYIFNKGTTTDVRVRVYEGTGTYARQAILYNAVDVHQGSKTIEELRTYYNNFILGYGCPISEQQ